MIKFKQVYEMVRMLVLYLRLVLFDFVCSLRNQPQVVAVQDLCELNQIVVFCCSFE